jgi:hypothetical protein
MGWHRDSDGDKMETTEVLLGIPEVAKVERLLLPFVDGNVRPV